MFRGEIENVIGTHGELKENNKKIKHHPTTPKKKKTWTPWMHSHLVSLAAKNFYASFVLFTINGRGIIWRNMVFEWQSCFVVVLMIGASSPPMVSPFIIRLGSFNAVQELICVYTFFVKGLAQGT